MLAFTAASGVLGARFSALHLDWAAATFTIIAAVSWLILGYLAVGLAIASAQAESSVVGLGRVNGTWFLWVVATQSVAVTSAALAHEAQLSFFAAVAALCWSVGILQLVVVAALVATCLLTHPLRASDEVAPYWVFMGSGRSPCWPGLRFWSWPKNRRSSAPMSSAPSVWRCGHLRPG